MNFRDKLDDIYSELINEFENNDNRQIVLNLIDELQNQIDNLK